MSVESILSEIKMALYRAIQMLFYLIWVICLWASLFGVIIQPKLLILIDGVAGFDVFYGDVPVVGKFSGNHIQLG